MNKTQTFLANQRQAMNGHNWRNASGGNGLANSPGNYGIKPQGWNANGGANAGVPADPYVILVSNASASAVSSFSLLGANKFAMGNYGGGSWSASGNFTLNGVTISMGFGSASISYQQFLGQIQQKNFTCGAVYINVISGNNAQASDVYNVFSVDGTGQYFNKAMVPLTSPNQYQANIIAQNTSFNVDGNTQLNWDVVYASTVFRVVLYPAVVINPTAVLNGTTPQMVNGAPKPFGTFN